MRKSIRGFVFGATIGFVIVLIAFSGALFDRTVGIDFLDSLAGKNTSILKENQRIVNEESAVIDAAENVSPSVVTVTVKTPERSILDFSPFGGFRRRTEGGQDVDIGSGFIVSGEGLIVTNKHVVSDTNALYKVVTKDDSEYDVESISRDPANDIAIIKISANNLKPIELGESGNLKVGQFVIAIGTALGEFRHTVTTGVISGLGRGITAGNAYEGYVERLSDVIQTDAAINPGNSGGPLLNASGQVVGVNVAIVTGAENIGFAIPINVVKEGLKQFNDTGKFAAKPYLGIEYQMISMRTAIMSQVPRGAYIINVVPGSPAESAGLVKDDIILKMDGVELKDLEEGVADFMKDKESGHTISMEVWRDGQTFDLSATLSDFGE